MNANKNEYYIEETLPDGSYGIVWRGTSAELALEALKKDSSENRLELWTKAHAETAKGFAPLAFKYQGKISLSHTFRFLGLNWVSN